MSIEDNIKDLKQRDEIQQRQIDDNTGAHIRVATLLENLDGDVRELRDEQRAMAKQVAETHAKVHNGLSDKVSYIERWVKEADQRFAGCVDVDTYVADHPSGVEVRRESKKRRLEVLTILIGFFALVGVIPWDLIFGG